MFNRRNFLQTLPFLSAGITLNSFRAVACQKKSAFAKPVVISTWDAGLTANKKAWTILQSGGRAIDAVEQGVRETEASLNCCVGLGANPDRDGHVTLDAIIILIHYTCI